MKKTNFFFKTVIVSLLFILFAFKPSEIPVKNKTRVHICRPVSVGVLPDITPKAHNAAYQAIEYWNRTLGCKVFQYEYKNIPDILVYDRKRLPIEGPQLIDDIFAYLDKNAIGCIHYFKEAITGCLISAVIYMKRKNIDTNSIEYVETLYRHEFGHALGLPDLPPNMKSLMSTISSKSKHPLDAEDNDIERLRLIYCPEK